MSLFSVNEVAELSGADAQTIRNLLASGQIESHRRSGIGRGQGHQFRTIQVIGFVVASEVKKSNQGCIPAYAVEVVKAFSAANEKWLYDQLCEGKRFFVRVHQGKVVLSSDGKSYGWPNVEAIYERVTDYAARKADSCR